MEVPFPLDYREQIQVQRDNKARTCYLTVAAPSKSPRRVRREARTLAVHLEVDVATPQMSSVASLRVLGFVALAVGHATRQAVRDYRATACRASNIPRSQYCVN